MTTRTKDVLTLVILSVLLASCISCRGTGSSNRGRGSSKRQAPIHEIDYTGGRGGGRGGLRECEKTGNGVYLVPVGEPRILQLWTWNGSWLINDITVPLPESGEVVPLSQNAYIASVDPTPDNSHDPWNLVAADMSTGDTIKSWPPARGWYCNRTGASPNGKFAAVTMRKFPAEGQTRVGIIDVSTWSLRWVAHLTATGGVPVRRIVVSDDGKYIAFAPFKYGVALVDAESEKVLWNQRPPGESSLDYVALSPDGATVYAGGVSGCVYGVDFRSGSVTSRWFANVKGESTYGHRISALAISPDGRWVAAGTGPEGHVFLWNTVSGGKPLMLDHGLITIAVVSFSPDSKYLASVAGGRIKVWKVPDGDAGIGE